MCVWTYPHPPSPHNSALCTPSNSASVHLATSSKATTACARTRTIYCIYMAWLGWRYWHWWAQTRIFLSPYPCPQLQNSYCTMLKWLDFSCQAKTHSLLFLSTTHFPLLCYGLAIERFRDFFHIIWEENYFNKEWQNMPFLSTIETTKRKILHFVLWPLVLADHFSQLTLLKNLLFITGSQKRKQDRLVKINDV